MKEVERWVKRNISTTLLSRKAVVMKNCKDNVLNFRELEERPKREKLYIDNGLELGVTF